MRHESDKKRDDTAIVEAILSRDADSSIENLSSAHIGSVGMWTRVVSSAKTSAPALGDEVIDSVMAEIRKSSHDANEGRAYGSKGNSIRAPWRGVIGGLAAAACLLLAISLFETKPDFDTKAPLFTQIPAPQTTLEIAEAPMTIAMEVETPYTALANTNVNANPQGAILLSKHDQSETIRITKAVRLEAVNGILRIGSL